MRRPFSIQIKPDWEGLMDCLMRKGTPRRVYFMDLFLDGEVQTAICERYGLLEGLNPNDSFFQYQRQVVIQRFLGYDYVRTSLEGMVMPINETVADDTASLRRETGRRFMDEHKGPITSWEDFERYPWPDPAKLATTGLEWYEKNLPDDMCMIAGGGYAHFAEYLVGLFGYESLCYALYEQRDLVRAISDKLIEMYRPFLTRLLQFKRLKIVWASDDMGFRSGTLISPKDLREFVLPGHKLMAEMSHAAGRPYLLHACGKLDEIMPDLIDDVRIDAKHSFEDTIESVIDAKAKYGNRIGLIGGMDVDFMCRSDVGQIRKRVRETLEKCMTGGGYCLGTGNSVANYIPLDNYLAMLDEGRRFGN